MDKHTHQHYYTAIDKQIGNNKGSFIFTAVYLFKLNKRLHKRREQF